MTFIITEPRIVGVEYTLDMAVVLPPIPMCLPLYTAAPMTNIEIVSISDSILTYKTLNFGSFEFSIFNNCLGEGATATQVQGDAVIFNATVSQQSEPYTFLPCCNDCFNPIIVSNLYEGDTYIAFSLDMEDGTVVKTASDDIGKVLDGKGVIELSESLIAGVDIQLLVDSPTCKATSSVVKVKNIPEDCNSCANPNACHIRLLNVSVRNEGVNLVSISRLNVEAFGELRYRLDNGEWFSDWSNIGSFSSLVNHTLGIKLVNNPACRIEYPFLAISYT